MKVLLMMVVVVVLDKSVQGTIKTHSSNLDMCEHKKVVDLVGMW